MTSEGAVHQYGDEEGTEVDAVIDFPQNFIKNLSPLGGEALQ